MPSSDYKEKQPYYTKNALYVSNSNFAFQIFKITFALKITPPSIKLKPPVFPAVVIAARYSLNERVDTFLLATAMEY